MKIRIRVSIAVPNERVREFELEFSGPEIYVGRDRESDIHIPLAEVSRQHARISRDENGWYIEDLGSSSGTRVGEHLVVEGEKYLLKDEDSIRIQSATLTVFVSNLDVIENTSDEKTALFAKKIVGDGIDNARQDIPYLLVMNGRREGLRAPLSMEIEQFTIGRKQDSHLFLDDTNVSRKHAIIMREWQDFLIEDAGSKNGVVVNGRRVTTVTRLKNGDEIFLGSLHLCFIDPTANMIERLEEIQDEIQKPAAKAIVAPVNESPVQKPTSQARSLLSAIGLADLGLAVFACIIIAGLVFAITNVLR